RGPQRRPDRRGRRRFGLASRGAGHGPQRPRQGDAGAADPRPSHHEGLARQLRRRGAGPWGRHHRPRRFSGGMPAGARHGPRRQDAHPPEPDRHLQRGVRPDPGRGRERPRHHRRLRPTGKPGQGRHPARRQDGRAPARRHGPPDPADRQWDRRPEQDGASSDGRNTDVSLKGGLLMGAEHHPLFQLGPDTTPYRKLTAEGVRVEKALGREILVVEPKALRLIAEQAMIDINHLLRPGHLAQLVKILDDPEATANDKFVAYDLLKNANIAAGGVLPMCQDTGTAIVVAKKGRRVWTDGADEEAIERGIREAYRKKNLRYSQVAPLSMFEETNTG